MSGFCEQKGVKTLLCWKNPKIWGILSIAFIALFGFSQVKWAIPSMAKEPKWVAFEEILDRELEFSDWGMNIKFLYSNVTYTTDGSGTDVLETESGSESLSLKPSPFFKEGLLGTCTTSKFSESSRSSSIFFAKPMGEPIKPAVHPVSKRLDFSLLTTNATSNETMDFNDQYVYETGTYNFATLEDSATLIYTTETTTAAVNLTGTYQRFNESLSARELATTFNNGPHQETDDTEVMTYVAGYADCWTGAITDLRNWIAQNNTVAADYVRIQDYNISEVWISYNISDGLATWIQNIADETIAESSSTGLAYSPNIWNPFESLVVPAKALNLGILDNLGKAVKSARIEFGVPLKEMTNEATSAYDRLRDQWEDISKTATDKPADKIWRVTTGILKDGLKNSGIADVAYEIKDGICNTAGEYIAKPIGSVVSGVSKFLGGFKWLLIGALVIGGLIALLVLLWYIGKLRKAQAEATTIR